MTVEEALQVPTVKRTFVAFPCLGFGIWVWVFRVEGLGVGVWEFGFSEGLGVLGGVGFQVA